MPPHVKRELECSFDVDGDGSKHLTLEDVASTSNEVVEKCDAGDSGCYGHDDVGGGGG
jgi:hypothetical protein